MKKILFLLLFVATVLVANARGKVTLTGKLNDLPDGTKLSLVPGAVHTQMDPIATATIVNGSFVLSFDIAEPRVLYLRADGARNSVVMLVAPGDKVTIDGTLNQPKVSGSAVNEQFAEKFTKRRDKLNQEYQAVMQQFAAVSKRMGAARTAKDPVAIAAVEASQDWIDYNKATSAQMKHFEELIEQIVTEDYDSYWAPMLILANTAYLTPDNEKHYNRFSEKARNSYYGKIFKEKLFGIAGVAPNFKGTDTTGTEKSLKEIIAGKNYVLVDFWASWCVPCRKFVPTVKELAAKYADKGLKVVSLSIDKDKKAWLKAVAEEKMPWLNLLDESDISKTYGITSIPAIYLIDPNGKIIFGKQSGDAVVQKLAAVFSGK